MQPSTPATVSHSYKVHTNALTSVTEHDAKRYIARHAAKTKKGLKLQFHSGLYSCQERIAQWRQPAAHLLHRHCGSVQADADYCISSVLNVVSLCWFSQSLNLVLTGCATSTLDCR